MSSSKRLIINCGASSITAAVVSFHGGSLQIDKLVTEDLHYDFSNDADWLDAIGEGLKTLTSVHKFSGKATLIIPGNQVLTKTIRIPHVEESKRAQIIAFEAQQNIPYPLHEVVWDSQVVGDDGVETEVLFIACKSNTIDDFCRRVSAAGLTTEAISAATVLDYNALQFAYPDLDEDVLLINIGARSTNLLFKNPDGFFVRNIALGGNSLTQSIADSLGKPFPQAEVVKQKFFAGSDFSEDDSGAKPLTASADAFMRRMSQEITRSIVNYRRQKNGAAPKQILLNGRGSLLRGLSEQLATSQKVEVSFFDPLQNVTLDGGIDSEPEILRLQISEIIGEACRGVVPASAGVNLLPEEIQEEMSFASKKPFLLIAAACLALAPWPAFLVFNQVEGAYQDQARALQSEMGPLQSRNAEISENIERAETLGQSIERVEGLVNSKTNWIQFFAELQGNLHTAGDVWLDRLTVLRERAAEGQEITYEVMVEGQMLVRESADGTEGIDENAITQRIRSLLSSFEDSEFIVSSRSPEINWRNLRQGLNVLPFSIKLVVDAAKPL